MNDEFKNWGGMFPSELTYPFKSPNIIFFACFPFLISFNYIDLRSSPLFIVAALIFEPWIILFSLGSGIRGNGNTSNFLLACLDGREYWEFF